MRVMCSERVNLYSSILCRIGENINQRDNEGNTALHHTVIGSKLEAAGWLVEHKAKINKQNKEQKTALDIALERGNQEIITLLKMFQRKYEYEKAENGG